MYKSVGPLFSFIENCEGPLGLIDCMERIVFSIGEKLLYTEDCSRVLCQVCFFKIL